MDISRSEMLEFNIHAKIKNRDADRSQIEGDIESFLASGGKVSNIEFGKSSIHYTGKSVSLAEKRDEINSRNKAITDDKKEGGKSHQYAEESSNNWIFKG